MKTIKELEKALTFDFDLMLKRVMLMAHVQNEIIELNQQEQLNEGIDATGKKIKTIASIEQKKGNVYSIFTIAEKASKGQDFKNVTLDNTGSFRKTFRLISKGEDWQIVANFNIHGEDIEDNFEIGSFDFLGLTDDNLDFFAHNTLLPELDKEFQRIKKSR